MNTYFFSFVRASNGLQFTGGTVSLDESIEGQEIHEAIKKSICEHYQLKAGDFCLTALNRL